MAGLGQDRHYDRSNHPLSSPRRLSSKWTFFNKRIFPVIWFGFLGVFVAIVLLGAGRGAKLNLEFFIGPLIMAVMGYVIMKKLVLDLVDEVWDMGDYLTIKNKGQEDRILLGNVLNISHMTFTNPPRITLTLRQSCRFGDEVTFSPPIRWNPFSRDPIAMDLIARVDAARHT